MTLACSLRVKHPNLNLHEGSQPWIEGSLFCMNDNGSLTRQGEKANVLFAFFMHTIEKAVIAYFFTNDIVFLYSLE
jgi:hypothetical protein